MCWADYRYKFRYYDNIRKSKNCAIEIIENDCTNVIIILIVYYRDYVYYIFCTIAKYVNYAC